MTEEDATQQWWEKKWREREDALIEVFGESWPPGAPEGHVLSLQMMHPQEWPDVAIPGACIQVFPPVPQGSHPTRLRRSDWLYLTLGLSQPPAPDELAPQRSRDDLQNLSWYGAEFGILLEVPENWVFSYLQEVMGYTLSESPVRGGHRIPFGFTLTNSNDRTWFMGDPSDLGVSALDETRAMIFWPYLGPAGLFLTSTGSFEILIGTSITGDEWAYAKETSSAHLLWLLCQAGIVQRTIFGRRSVLSDPRLAREADRVRSFEYERVAANIDAWSDRRGRCL